MNKQVDTKRPKVSIVILDFLKSKRVCENVESLQKQKTDFEFEIIIVDNSCNAENAEKINSLKKFENVQIQINKENVGYIKGNNQGAAVAKGEYLMIVNPDIIWPNHEVMQKLVDYMEGHPKTGVCGPKQINDNDNSVAMTVRAFPNIFLQVARRTFLRRLPLIKKWVAYDEMQHLDYKKTQTVDWLQSSFWITRKALWDKIGGLDKAYFIFMSDPEYCYRVWKAGFEVVYYPEVTVHADGRRASEGGFKAFFKKWTLRQHLKDALIYQFKHLFNRNPHKKV
jgi:N-acetylglucosaminyl-diphospho-decaprenol L-rhamnosyltransferase